LLGAIVTLIGCGAGFVVQQGLQALLSDVVSQQLPSSGWAPWAQGAAVTMTLVCGFALPPLLRLREASTLRVLRREWNALEPLALSAWALGAVLLALLMWWVAGDVTLWLIVLGGFVGAIAIYALLARVLLAALGRVRQGGRAIGWRYGVANLRRHWRATLAQAVALGLSMTALLLLTVARGDLLAAWQSRVPPDAPNRFVINIQPDQLQAIGDYFVAQGLPRPLLEPMVRGRLVSINDRSVEPHDYPDERAQRLVEREFNLSWTQHLPGGNSVTQGRWYGAARDAQFSVEQGLAETLHLKLGDALTYDIGGTRVTATITSLRKLEWDSMRVNFFVVAPPGLIDQLPASYISSFHLPREHVALIAGLVQRFPNLTVIDVEAILKQLQGTVDKVVRAVEGVFGFALLAGLAVLYAALQATADQRAHEIAVLRALGAREGQLRTTLIAEFAVLGAIAGTLAGGGTALISLALARWAFHLPYMPNPLLLIVGLVGGVVLVVSAGLLGSRTAQRGSPLQALREAA
jgi:putative ABC transport system permease protein